MSGLVYIHIEDPSYHAPPWPGVRVVPVVSVEAAIEQAAHDASYGAVIRGIYDEDGHEALREGEVVEARTEQDGSMTIVWKASGRAKSLKRPSEIAKRGERAARLRLAATAQQRQSDMDAHAQTFPQGVTLDALLKLHADSQLAAGGFPVEPGEQDTP